MFIKVTKSGKYEYAQLVESYRGNGATRHRVMLNLGRLDHIRNNPSFQRLALKLAELSAVKTETNNNIEDILRSRNLQLRLHGLPSPLGAVRVARASGKSERQSPV
jgi:hypothetical protein